MILVLSPHLDDAVLSCPTFLQRNRGESRIVTFFTVGLPADLYRLRREEDRVAARILEVRLTQLRQVDAPFRITQFDGFSTIVFGPAERSKQLEGIVARLIRRYQPTLVLAPLGVGNHVDHRLVRDAALKKVPHHLLRFYEDRPYAFVEEQIDHVLGRRAMGTQPAEFWRRYTQVAYVRNYLAGIGSATLKRGWRGVPGFPVPLRLSAELHPTRRELARTVDAIRAYKSQVPDLFRDDAELAALYSSRPERQYGITME